MVRTGKALPPALEERNEGGEPRDHVACAAPHTLRGAAAEGGIWEHQNFGLLSPNFNTLCFRSLEMSDVVKPRVWQCL